MTDEYYMRRAIALAQKGEGQVSPNPLVGAVIVKDGKIIGEGYHEHYGQPHAERNALANCIQSPEGATIYVTLEPCAMCCGAIAQARLRRVYFGAYDPKGGFAVSNAALLSHPALMHKAECYCGIMEDECAALLRKFFSDLRQSDLRKQNQ